MTNRLMIAGTGSGCGKTTVTCALLAALASAGKDVISFKCGPDYIDPMFHKKVTGVESRNLDIFLMGENGVKYSVFRHTANKDVAVMEGVMGLYDGLGNGSFSSSNQISVLTNTPTILIVNAKGAALSVCAVIKGFLEFEKNNIRGVILNNVSEAMYSFYKQMIESRINIQVVGFMPHIPEAQIESRHLGLVTADEITGIREKINTLKESALKFININAILEISKPTESLHYENDFLPPFNKDKVVRVYVASDEAFCFWYEDNHDLLKALGVEVCFFSPVHGHELPSDADGLVLWGGYPELHAATLEKNTSMKNSLKTAISNGLPVYAEGGGFMYLHQNITDLQERTYEMLGVLPGKVKMTQRLQNFGYYEIEAQKDNLLCGTGDKINAHFFHRSVSDFEGDCFKAVKQSGKTFPCMVVNNNIAAGYQHLHFWGNIDFAKNFVNSCIKYKSGRDGK